MALGDEIRVYTSQQQFDFGRAAFNVRARRRGRFVRQADEGTWTVVREYTQGGRPVRELRVLTSNVIAIDNELAIRGSDMADDERNGQDVEPEEGEADLATTDFEPAMPPAGG